VLPNLGWDEGAEDKRALFFFLKKKHQKTGTCPLSLWMFPENLGLIRWIGMMLCYV